MASVKVFKQTGEAAGTMKLDDAVFGAEYNEALIHSVIVAQMNNKRQGTMSALTRSEVRGGGIKPWRQKGTGRARQGSIRSPQWTGGGVVFAKKPRDFSQKINKVAKRQAIKSALSQKVVAGEFLVLDDLKIGAPKTKEIATVIKNLKLDRTVLLVLPEYNAEIYRAAKNIPNLKTTFADLINVYDLVAIKDCLVLKSAVKKIEEAYNDSI